MVRQNRKKSFLPGRCFLNFSRLIIAFSKHFHYFCIELYYTDMDYNDILDFFKKVWGQIERLLKLFIDWRERRIDRFKELPQWRKAVNSALTILGLFIFFLFLVDFNFFWLFGKSPTIKTIANPPQSLSSEIISADGELLGKYYTENRKIVTLDEVSEEIVNTLISTEDRRFYRHLGIDIKGLFSAAKDALTGNPRGASTITQQLVKNMFKTRSQYSRGFLGALPGLRLPIEKTKEWTAATKLEILYSKKEILEMYLNTVSFGSNAYGIHTASNTYFGIGPDSLNYEQSAVLVGLLKAITAYNPYLNPDRSLSRRNTVIELLAKNKYISVAEADSLKQLPIELSHSVTGPAEGVAPYFRNHLTRYLERWGDNNGYDIYSDGLKIHVTIDSRMQRYAEDAVKSQLRIIQRNFFAHWRGQNPWRDEEGRELKNFIPSLARRSEIYKSLDRIYSGDKDSIDKYMNLPKTMRIYDPDLGSKEVLMSSLDSIKYMSHIMHCGFVAMEPDSKHVKAWVGDIDYKFWHYDKVAQGRRQLFVYAAGLIAGKSPCDRIPDIPFTWGTGQYAWSPRNAGHTFSYENMTLKRGFAKSVNTVAAQLAKEVGVSKVAEAARLLGVKSPLEEVPTLSLGASDVNLLEMVNAYGTVINDGLYVLPIFVTRIEDKDGYVIYESKVKPKRVLSYENSFLMTEMLKGGITEPGGTSRALWNYDLMRWDTEFGGKTGTSSNYSDAWYIGVTPKLVAGAWVGAEHRSVHFRSGALGQASRTALPVFARFMEKVLSDKEFEHYRAKFPAEPKELIKRDYKCNDIEYLEMPGDSVIERVVIEALPIPEVSLGGDLFNTTEKREEGPVMN